MIKRIADRFFAWFCDPECYADISGDLEEIYTRNAAKHSILAQWKYLGQVIVLLRPSIAKPLNLFTHVPLSMFRNYFKISARSMMRHKVFSLINVLGLSIGLSTFILISSYVNFENNYDRLSGNAENIYRISSVNLIDGQAEAKDAMAARPLKARVDSDIPESRVSTATKFLDDIVIKNGEDIRRERLVVSGDENFLKIFPYEVIHGSAGKLLDQPNSIVFTETKAKSYFGEENAIGQTITLAGDIKGEFLVTGVIEDVPANTHYKFEILISDKSLSLLPDYDSFNYYNYYLYTQLEENTDTEAVKSKLTRIIQEQDKETALTLIPITDIHLYSDFSFEPGVSGNPQVIRLLQLISILVIAIALVNYINLTTTRAMTRSREVGIRKVIGARKNELIVQFMLEAFIVNFLALLIAVILVESAGPVYNNLVGTDVFTGILNLDGIWPKLSIIFLTGSLLSGIYPSMVLSGFEPVKVLKGKLTTSKSGILTRKALVVIQFIISLLIVGGALIVNEQIKYMSSKDLGIDPNAVISLTAPQISNEEEFKFLQSMKEELLQGSYVDGVGFTSNAPGGNASDINSTSMEIDVPGLVEDLNGTTYLQFVDGDFFDVMKMELLAGRNIDMELASDSSALMINRSLMQRLGVNDASSVIGKSMTLGSSNHFTIIGVISDFHRTSVKSEIEPSIYAGSYDLSQMVIRLNRENIAGGLEYVEGIWEKFYPENPFTYEFVDSRFEALYREDRRFANVSFVFSLITISIAMLGLYGLISFMTTLRTREVGIRKVLGASLGTIMVLFVKEFVIIIVIAAVVCSPFMYYTFNSWLSGYAFHIDFPIWVIPVSFISLLILSVAIISTQLMRVIHIDPVETLKYE